MCKIQTSFCSLCKRKLDLKVKFCSERDKPGHVKCFDDPNFEYKTYEKFIPGPCEDSERMTCARRVENIEREAAKALEPKEPASFSLEEHYAKKEERLERMRDPSQF